MRTMLGFSTCACAMLWALTIVSEASNELATRLRECMLICGLLRSRNCSGGHRHAPVALASAKEIHPPFSGSQLSGLARSVLMVGCERFCAGAPLRGYRGLTRRV